MIDEMQMMKSNLHHIAILARAIVIAGEATKEEMFCYIMETGNEEFEKAFAMSDGEVMLTMLSEIAESGNISKFIDEIVGEEQ